MKKIILFLLVVIVMLSGCDINLNIGSGHDFPEQNDGMFQGDDLDRQIVSDEIVSDDIDKSSSVTSVIRDKECDNYVSGVATGFDMYTKCVDNELTKAMRSGDPYYCEIAIISEYVDVDTSHKVWVLGDLLKYEQTTAYPDGEVQKGTFILKKEGTYVSTSNTLFIDTYDQSEPWHFMPTSEKTPSYNFAGDINPPSTVTCQKKNFGKEMFDTDDSSSVQTGSTTTTTSTSLEKLEQSVRVISGNAAAKWGYAHGSLNHIRPEWNAELELETPSSIDMVFKDPFETEEKKYKVQIFSERGLTEEFSVLIKQQEVTLAPGKYTIKITPNTDTASWNVAW